ncbi:MAG: phage scaffolding protein [Clostridia bacterium]|nr:phage scaffolding protein [Clostridia bacterium]
MKTEELLNLGLTREQADSILAINGRDIERTKSVNQQERLELERVLNELADTKQELENYRSMDYEGLKNELNSWKEKAGQAELAAKKMTEKSILCDEKEKLYLQNGVKNTEVLDALINWEEVSVEGDSVIGLDGQISQVKEQYGYLFHSDSDLPQFSAAMGDIKESDGTSAVREAMGI